MDGPQLVTFGSVSGRLFAVVVVDVEDHDDDGSRRLDRGSVTDTWL